MRNGGRLLAAGCLAAWTVWIFRSGLRAPFVPPSPAADVVVVLGAGGGLLLALVLSLRRSRAAAAASLLGGTAASLALALRPGTYAKPFFLAFLPVVLPCLAVALLVREGAGEAPEETRRRKAT